MENIDIQNNIQNKLTLAEQDVEMFTAALSMFTVGYQSDQAKIDTANAAATDVQKQLDDANATITTLQAQITTLTAPAVPADPLTP